MNKEALINPAGLSTAGTNEAPTVTGLPAQVFEERVFKPGNESSLLVVVLIILAVMYFLTQTGGSNK